MIRGLGLNCLWLIPGVWNCFLLGSIEEACMVGLSAQLIGMATGVALAMGVATTAPWP